MVWCRVDNNQLSKSVMIPFKRAYTDGLVQDYNNANAKALELLRSCTKPSVQYYVKKYTWWCHTMSTLSALLTFCVTSRTPEQSRLPSAGEASLKTIGKSLQWRHNGRDGVSNHQPHDCLPKRLFRRWSKKTSKLRVTGLCAGNSRVTGEFPAQMANNAENVSIGWRHHVNHMNPWRIPDKINAKQITTTVYAYLWEYFMSVHTFFFQSTLWNLSHNHPLFQTSDKTPT